MLRSLRTTLSPAIERADAARESADLHSDEIDRLRGQLWVGLMLATLVVVWFSFTVRIIMRDPTPPSSIIILGALTSIAVANLYYRNTPRTRIVQGIYVVCIHFAVPPVLVLYGGTRGFGDVALLIAVILTLLYGWRCWMLLTFGVIVVTLVWVLYHDIIGDPVAPLLDYSAQFTTLKFFIMTLIMIFILRYTAAFYRGLLHKYLAYADEQVRLNRELQISRQNLVTAREEERRRLRRDLHDGLGPTLAAQVFRVGAAQQWITKDADKAGKILDDLQNGIEGTLTTIRQLVYELRPPMLDQLGLVGAITDFVNRLESPVEIKLDLPAQLPPLSAAVEVAAFRIMQTALDNVIKHAEATHCDLRLTAAESSLGIKVTDDGVGITGEWQGERYVYRAGVGLTSMRERAEELGGRFAISPITPHGTQMLVSIPLLPLDAKNGVPATGVL